MAAINISAERVKQVTDVVIRHAEGFQPLSESFTKEDFLTIYDETVAWYDHGFHVCRIGHEAVLGLQKGFLHCNQPFKATVKVGDAAAMLTSADLFQTLQVTLGGAAVEQLWIGRCTNDIVRPDGQIIMKGSGKDFQCHVALFYKISDAGKITRIDEYDHRYWDEGKAEEKYIQVGAISHKEA